jgi:hypothetical protein
MKSYTSYSVKYDCGCVRNTSTREMVGYCDQHKPRTWKCADGHVFKSTVNAKYQYCPKCKQTMYCELKRPYLESEKDWRR